CRSMKLATPQSLPEGESWSAGMIVSTAATKNACSVAVNVSSGSSTGGAAAVVAAGAVDDVASLVCCAAAGAAGASAAAPATVKNSRRPIFGSFAMTILPQIII